MNKRDKELLEESLGTLERMHCQFWACEGPTLRPKNMITCCRCHLLAKLAKRLGQYIPRRERSQSERWNRRMDRKAG